MAINAVEAAGLLSRLTDPDPDPDPLPAWAQAVSAHIDLDVLCDVVVRADVDAAFAEYSTDREFIAQLRASVQENLRTLQHVLCGRTTLAEVRLTQPLEFGAVQARLCIPQTALQRSYRVGFFAMWTEWSAQVTRYAAGAGVPAEQAMGALTGLSRHIFEYQDHVASAVAENYARTEQAFSRSRAHVRQQLVRALLAGEGLTVESADRVTIDYEFDAHHLAFLLLGTGEDSAARKLTGAFAVINIRRPLVQPLSLSSSVVWVSRTRSWTSGAIDELAAVLSDMGLSASIGEPGRALSGFRHAYRTAVAVERIRTAWGVGAAPQVLRESDVRLELLLSGDADAAGRFVSQELGPLAASTAEAERLRHTLEASYRFGSHVAAAEQLRLHEHTVRNRLRRIEELLGRELHQRPTETQVALRLHRLIAGGSGHPEP